MNAKQLSSLLVLAVALTAVTLQAATPPANPELVGALAKEIGATSEQAEGAAGALFGLAKARLKPEDWSKVAGAVPGMDGLLRAAPVVASGAGSTMARAVPEAASLGGLSGVAGAFNKLGLKPETATKAVPVLTAYVSKTGGAEAGKILAEALR